MWQHVSLHALFGAIATSNYVLKGFELENQCLQPKELAKENAKQMKTH